MPIEQFLLLLGVAIAGIVTLVGVIVAAWREWRRNAEPVALVAVAPAAEPGADPSIPRERNAAAAADLYATRPGAADRVVRVIAFVFLAAVAVFVAVTDAFPDTAVGIELLVAAGILFVVFVQDLLPVPGLGHLRYWVQAVVAIGFMTLLVGMSGGLSSPFLPGFFLIVAGASLAIDGLAPVLLSLLAGLAYTFAGLLVARPGTSLPTELVWLGFNLVTLALLAYLGTMTGREQRHARDAAIRLSRFDSLTGLYNRSYFFSAMDGEIRRAVRMGRGFSLLMLDVDDLKAVNDTFGHQSGDRLLRAVTGILQRSIRGTDVAARYGGDEFVVLLAETEPSGAFVVAEKLRSDIAGLALRVDDRSMQTSVSIGLVAYGEDGATIDTLIRSADAAMYEAKRRGKNQIVGYATQTERVVTAMGPGPASPNGAAPDGNGRRPPCAGPPTWPLTLERPVTASPFETPAKRPSPGSRRSQRSVPALGVEFRHVRRGRASSSRLRHPRHPCGQHAAARGPDRERGAHLPGSHVRVR